jgi:hypothetical protein
VVRADDRQLNLTIPAPQLLNQLLPRRGLTVSGDSVGWRAAARADMHTGSGIKLGPARGGRCGVAWRAAASAALHAGDGVKVRPAWLWTCGSRRPAPGSARVGEQLCRERGVQAPLLRKRRQRGRLEATT